MFCGNCGKEIADGKKFCPYCGNSLAGTVPAMKKKAVEKKPKKETREKRPKKEFHVNKALIVTLVEIIILAGLIYGFMRFGRSVYGPEALANEYMKALAEDDWDTIMGLTDVEESDFLDENSLKNAISETVTGDFDSYDINLKNSRGGTATVQVKYGSGGRNRDTLALEMEKQDERALFLFDTWKVSAENYILKDFAIYAPKGTDAYLDGRKLDDGLIKEGYVGDVDDDIYYSGYGDSLSAYVIPEIYKGKHTAAALVGDNTIAADEFVASEDNRTVTLSEISLTEKLQEEIVSIAVYDMQRIIDAEVNAKPFSEISDLYVDLQDGTSYVQSEYENALYGFYAYERESGIKDVSIYDIKGTMQDFYLDGEGNLTAQVVLDYMYDTVAVNKWWTGEQEEIERGNNTGERYLSMVYDNGEWKIKESQLYYGL